jgi:hypothetical protein
MNIGLISAGAPYLLSTLLRLKSATRTLKFAFKDLANLRVLFFLSLVKFLYFFHFSIAPCEDGKALSPPGLV